MFDVQKSRSENFRKIELHRKAALLAGGQAKMRMPVKGDGAVARRGGKLHVGLRRVFGKVALEDDDR